MKEEFLIRAMGAQDYARVSEIMDQVQRLHVEWRPDVYRPNYPLITAAYFEECLNRGGWYVAEADGKVAGVMELMRRHVEDNVRVTRDVLYIATMAVDAPFRGRGIGHAFFKKAKQIRDEQGLSAVELQVNAKNTQAMEMYKACGFTVKSVNMELI